MHFVPSVLGLIWPLQKVQAHRPFLRAHISFKIIFVITKGKVKATLFTHVKIFLAYFERINFSCVQKIKSMTEPNIHWKFNSLDYCEKVAMEIKRNALKHLEECNLKEDSLNKYMDDFKKLDSRRRLLYSKGSFKRFTF